MDIASVALMSRSSVARIECWECTLVVEDGQYHPSNRSKILTCRDGIVGTPLPAQWEPFGRLYDSGYCKRIKVLFLATTGTGGSGDPVPATLTFTAPTVLGQQPSDPTVYDTHVRRVVTFDDSTTTKVGFSPVWHTSGDDLTGGGADAITIKITIEGEQTSKRLSRSTAEVYEVDDGSPSNSLVKKYRHKGRFAPTAAHPRHDWFWWEFTWQEVSDVLAQAPYSTADTAPRSIRWWFRWGYSKSGTSELNDSVYQLSSPVMLEISQASANISVKMPHERLWCGAASTTSPTGRTFILANPNPSAANGRSTLGPSDEADRGGSGFHHPFFGNGNQHNVHGTIFATEGVAAGIETNSATAFAEDPWPGAICRNYSHGRESDGRPHMWEDAFRRGTWLSNHVPRWYDGGSGVDPWGTPLPPPYADDGGEVQAYASLAYLHEERMTRYYELCDYDPFFNANDRFANWGDGHFFLQSTGGSVAFGTSKLWKLAAAGCPHYDGYFADCYRATFRPGFWMTQSVEDWKPQDAPALPTHRSYGPVTIDGIDILLNKSRVWLYEGTPFTYRSEFDKMGVAGVNPSASEVRGPSPRDTVRDGTVVHTTTDKSGDAWMGDVEHMSFTFGFELYMLTGDYLLGQICRQYALMAACSLRERVPYKVEDSSYNIPFRDHSHSGTRPRIIGRAWQCVGQGLELLREDSGAHAADLSARDFLTKWAIGRWYTVDRGTLAEGGMHFQAFFDQRQLANCHNREFPDFENGELDSATNPYTDTRMSVLYPHWPQSGNANGPRYDGQRTLDGPRSPATMCTSSWRTAVDNERRDGYPYPVNHAGFILCKTMHMDGYAIHGLIQLSRSLWTSASAPAFSTSVDELKTLVALEMEWLASKIAKTNGTQCWGANGHGLVSGPPLYFHTTKLDDALMARKPLSRDILRDDFFSMPSPDNRHSGGWAVCQQGAGAYTWGVGIAPAMYYYDMAMMRGDTVGAAECKYWIDRHNPGGGDYYAPNSGGYGWGDSVLHGSDGAGTLTEWTVGRLTFYDRAAPGGANVDLVPYPGSLVEVTSTSWASLGIQAPTTDFDLVTFDPSGEITVTKPNSGQTVDVPSRGYYLTNMELDGTLSTIGQFVDATCTATLVDMTFADATLSLVKAYVNLASSIDIVTIEGTGDWEIVSRITPTNEIVLIFDAIKTLYLTDGAGTVDVTNIQFYANNDAVYKFVLRDSDGVAVALSSSDTIEHGVFESPVDGNRIITKSTGGDGITITSPSAGEFTITYDAEDTEGKSGKFYHEIKLTRASGAVTTIAHGSFDLQGTRL